MGRISRQSMYMGMARLASQRSTCFRLNVGAIITHENSPVSVGWNGAAAGMPHCAGNDCPGVVPGNCGTLHAEANALRKAEILIMGSRTVIPEVDLYCTDSQCGECGLAIRESRLYVKRVFFETPYRDPSALDPFRKDYQDPEYVGQRRHTDIYMVTPAGYIVEYFSRKVVELP